MPVEIESVTIGKPSKDEKMRAAQEGLGRSKKVIPVPSPKPGKKATKPTRKKPGGRGQTLPQRGNVTRSFKVIKDGT